jgi:hypothetical protein
LASELISRKHEGVTGPLPLISQGDLEQEFVDLEDRIHAVSRLRRLTSSDFQTFARRAKLFILINYTSGPREGTFEAEGFYDNASAASKYSQLERELQDVADVVLVGSSQQDAIRLAYTNYFSDASAFIAAIDGALSTGLR